MGFLLILTFQNSITSKLIIQHYFKTRIVIVCYLVEIYFCIFELHFFISKRFQSLKGNLSCIKALYTYGGSYDIGHMIWPISYGY